MNINLFHSGFSNGGYFQGNSEYKDKDDVGLQGNLIKKIYPEKSK